MTLGTLQTGVPLISPVCRAESKTTTFKIAILSFQSMLNTQLDCNLFLILQILPPTIFLA
jgi:hypothetical protein